MKTTILKKSLAVLFLFFSTQPAWAQNACAKIFSDVAFIKNPYMDINRVEVSPLNERLAALIAKYPKNIALAKDVRIKAQDERSALGVGNRTFCLFPPKI